MPFHRSWRELLALRYSRCWEDRRSPNTSLSSRGIRFQRTSPSRLRGENGKCCETRSAKQISSANGSGIEHGSAFTTSVRPRSSSPHSGFDPVYACLRVRLDFVFPNPNNSPSTLFQQGSVRCIPIYVSSDLRPPVVRSESVLPFVEPPAVPKIAIHKDEHLVPCEHQIRLAGEPSRILPVSQPPGEAHAPNDQFRGSVRHFNAGHRATSLLPGHIVCHGALTVGPRFRWQAL
jgi:hypothetical protein